MGKIKQNNVYKVMNTVPDQLWTPSKWKLLGQPHLAQRWPVKINKDVGARCPLLVCTLDWLLLLSFSLPQVFKETAGWKQHYLYKLSDFSLTSHRLLWPPGHSCSFPGLTPHLPTGFTSFSHVTQDINFLGTFGLCLLHSHFISSLLFLQNTP